MFYGYLLHKTRNTALFRVQSLRYISNTIISLQTPMYGCIPLRPSVYKVPEEVVTARAEHSKVYRLVEAYRRYGFLQADVNPLCSNALTHDSVPELSPAHYGFSDESERCSKAVLGDGSCTDNISVVELVALLQKYYCGHITAEFMHAPTEAEREWFANEFESGKLLEPLSVDEKLDLCQMLLTSQAWDNFMANKFPSLKRYGGEGAESIMPYYQYTFRALANSGIQHAIIGMGHRGRLNVLQDILKVSPSLIFHKIFGFSEFHEQFTCTGDTIYHFTAQPVLEYDSHRIHIDLLANPSHLEAVDPVSMGRTRSYHRNLQTGHYSSLSSSKHCQTELESLPDGLPVCIQVHGDAAVFAQGVVQESQTLASMPNYNIGGILHCIVNNQIGFTTYTSKTSSIAYLTQSPIIRVNGDKPESVARAAELAVSYREKFGKDVFVDLICWRRHGHNELDDPRFTNPAMYSIIDAKKSVPDTYATELLEAGLITEQQLEYLNKQSFDRLRQLYQAKETPQAEETLAQWRGLRQCPPGTVEVWDTGVPEETLRFVADASVRIPSGFNLHPHLAKTHVAARLAKLTRPHAIDWATAEVMAFGSLLMQGKGVRLSGQDVGRGTFAHRHCILVDQVTEQNFLPLNVLSPDQTAFLEVANSTLSEEAVVGYEYGMSINCPDVLYVWESQFGDFFNGAQIMFDTYVSSGESKWLYQSCLTILLPHGYDGAGPEHSSCRIERFLSCCCSADDKADGSDVNWSVATPTTPAQYFHLLRRQMVRPYRKPLIVVAPKVMLRLPAATSDIAHMVPGTYFMPLIDDVSIEEAGSVRRLVFTAGKHYYALAAERATRGLTDTAIVRLESICPFPAHQINQVVKKYRNATKIVWSQEEPRNMGCWPFVFPRFLNICGTKVTYAGQSPLAAPSVGSGELHQKAVREIIEQTFR